MSMSSEHSVHASGNTLGVGEIIASAFALTTRIIVSLFVLNLPVYILYVVIFGGMYFGTANIGMGASPFGAVPLNAANPVARFGAFIFVLDAIYLIVWLIVSCAMIRVIHARFNAIREPILTSTWEGFKRSLPVFGLSLLVMLVTVVAMMVVGLVMSTLAFLLGPLVIVLVLAAFVGLFYAFFPYFLAGIVCVVEESSPLVALTRSRMLTDDYRWPLLGLMLVSALILGALDLVMLILSRTLLLTTHFGAYVVLGIGSILFPYVTGWTIAVYTIAYNRLYILKGGTPRGAAVVANVFE